MSKILEKAKELEREDDLKVSYTYYEMVLGDKSCPFDIRADMGRVLNKLRDYNESSKCFDTVLTMDENHIGSLFGKGIALLGLNKWDDALNFFLKANKIDDSNANFYYYISIILQSKSDDGAYEYYTKFMELDNDEFEQIRSKYNFGLIFLNAESELANDKKINLKAFEDKLNSFDLSQDEIELYLKTLPYEDLISKINELDELAYAENEKKIIRGQYLEMGLNDNDIDDLFLMESVDYLKEDIISRTKTNPFPNKNECIIPLYDEEDYELISSKYIFEEIVIKENFGSRVKNKLKGIRNSTKAMDERNENIYSIMRKEIFKNNFENAKWFSEFIDESIISNESIKINFIYTRGLILAHLNLDLNKVLDDFNTLEKKYPKIKDDENYAHNKITIENDLEKKAIKR